MNIFLIQIKEVCDRIKPSFSPSEEGNWRRIIKSNAENLTLKMQPH
jgi:hypothetical protein